MTSAPQRAWLQDPVHFAWCGPDIVVLDTRSDEYALLPDLAETIRPGETPGAVLAQADVLDDLASAGLVTRHPPTTPRPALPARRGDLVANGASPSPFALADALVHGLVATAAFHRKDMAGLIASAGRRRRTPAKDCGERAARAARAFAAVQPWMPFEGDCLQRGFMLHAQLRRTGVPALWVFGVRTWPFLAHCWVQIDDRIVGDSLERVSGFTPIMAVG